jgi:hypothetical protein
VNASRYVDAETLSYIGLAGSPVADELRNWKAQAVNTKSFIMTTTADKKVIYPTRDWFYGTKDNNEQDRRNETDLLLPYYALGQANGEDMAFFCRFPASEKSVAKKGIKSNVLVLLPESNTEEASTPSVGRSVRMGCVVPSLKDNNKTIGDDMDLVFKLAGSNTESSGVTEYGTLQWHGNNSAGNNYWELSVTKNGTAMPIKIYNGRVDIGNSSSDITVNVYGSTVKLGTGANTTLALSDHTHDITTVISAAPGSPVTGTLGKSSSNTSKTKAA